jgi:hypothetical protein
MNILKISRLNMLWFCLLAIACAEDKGNYTYEDKAVITIDSISSMLSVLANAEYIDLKPVVTSNLEGIIDERNTNFEFAYQRKNSEGEWEEVANTKDLHMLAALESGRHAFLFSVTDKRTEVKTLKLFYVNATTITSEGWMLLCDEGSEERMRLDMLAQISVDRIVPAYDVIRRKDGVPEQYHVANIGLYATGSATGNRIIAMSEDAAYWLETTDSKGGGEFLDVESYHELKSAMFLAATDDHIVNFVSVPYKGLYKPEHDAVICVSREGNVYAWNTVEVETGFEYPINTSVRGGTPEYKVAPYVGTTLKRPLSSDFGIALLFDTDNHRFVYWSGEGATGSDVAGKKQVLHPLEDPENKNFSYNTGNMDLVCMLNTSFSEGMVYSIMQEDGKRHIYEVNLGSGEFKQGACHLDVMAENFANATCFEASSQYYVIYYAYGNKVYAYNVGSGVSEPVITLEDEEITCLKFNRYDYPWGVDYLCSKYDEDIRNIYRDRENQLIVGSYKNDATDNNGGMLRFYDVSGSGMKLTLKPGWEYSGFAKIKDVRYKEAR